ncbi:hypothetical protein TNCV_4525931 [Trichonephila clavipes]|nr:hypothetical protein TNCV_4525931 [Trichonephila clavipes]
MHRRQTARPHIWILCPPRRHSFYEAILPSSSEASVSSVTQAPSIATQRYTVMSIMAFRHTGVADPRPDNGQCPQSHVHCLQLTSEPPALIYQARHV